MTTRTEEGIFSSFFPSISSLHEGRRKSEREKETTQQHLTPLDKDNTHWSGQKSMTLERHHKKAKGSEEECSLVTPLQNTYRGKNCSSPHQQTPLTLGKRRGNPQERETERERKRERERERSYFVGTGPHTLTLALFFDSFGSMRKEGKRKMSSSLSLSLSLCSIDRCLTEISIGEA